MFLIYKNVYLKWTTINICDIQRIVYKVRMYVVSLDGFKNEDLLIKFEKQIQNCILNNQSAKKLYVAQISRLISVAGLHGYKKKLYVAQQEKNHSAKTYENVYCTVNFVQNGSFRVLNHFDTSQLAVLCVCLS